MCVNIDSWLFSPFQPSAETRSVLVSNARRTPFTVKRLCQALYFTHTSVCVCRYLLNKKIEVDRIWMIEDVKSIKFFFCTCFNVVSDEFHYQTVPSIQGVLRGLHRIHHGGGSGAVGPAPCFFVGQTGDF